MRTGASERGTRIPGKPSPSPDSTARRLSVVIASLYPCSVPTSTYASPTGTPSAVPPSANQAFTSVPMYSSVRSRRSQRVCSSARMRPVSLKAPQTQCDDGVGCFTCTSSTRPWRSVTTASKYSGCSTGKSRNERPPPGSWRKPSAGNHTVSGSPTSTSSSGAMNGSARKIASHSPAGLGCTVKHTWAEHAPPP